MAKSSKCNPSYIVGQPVMLQRVDILFHHYQLSAPTSMQESVRTHTHRISKSVHGLATVAVDVSGRCRLTAQVWSIWAKLYVSHQLQERSDCSFYVMYAAVRTVSPKRRLTRPLNGWKPDSRILFVESSWT